MKNRSMDHEFTICSVSFNSKEFLELNYEFTQKLNPKDKFRWLIIENSPKASKNKIIGTDARFQVIENKVNRNSIYSHGSYHHAHGLNKALKYINTRFVLFLDPDYFIVRNNWISDILNYMDINNVSFLGAPYHPSKYIKYRYFPSIICMFIDLEKINKGELDFTPEIFAENSSNSEVSKTLEEDKIIKFFFDNLKNYLRSNKYLYKPSLEMIEFINYTFKRSIIINSSKDTGFKIYKRYSQFKKVNAECLISVFRQKDQQKDIVQKIAEPFIPDHWCYVPKKKSYFSEIGFRDLGFYDVDYFGWEEYLWQNEAFGFHIGGVFQGLKEVSIDSIKQILKSFEKGR